MMDRVAGDSAAARSHVSGDLGPEPAPEGGSLFGINWARLIKIPLRRWKLSLVLLAVSTVAAIAYARQFSTSYYELTGTLTHRPQAEQKDSPSARTIETFLEEMKSPQYYQHLDEKFGLSIPPEHFARMFDVKRGIEGSQIISVSLKWEDSAQGADLVNSLMEHYRKEVDRARKAELEKARQAAADALADCERRRQEAVKRRDQSLRGKPLTGSPKDRLADINGQLARLDVQIETAETESLKLKEALQLVVDGVEAIKSGKVKNETEEDEGSQEAFKQRKTQIELNLINTRLDLSKAEGALKTKEKDLAVKKPLAEKGIIIQPVIAELEREIAALRGEVDAAKKRLKIHEKEEKELRPDSPARLRRLLAERSALQLKLAAAQRELDRYKLQRDNQRKEAEAMEALEKDWTPLDAEVKSIEKEREVLRTNQAEVQFRLRNLPAELEIGSPAAPSVSPISNKKKQLVLGFMIPLLLGFGLLIGMELVSTTWRAESLAEKLRLPVLARLATGAGRSAAGAESSPAECRSLSLRIRQFVPDTGAVVLVSSLREGEEVDRLVIGMSRFLGMRNERVLILDARITQAEDFGLAGLIERRADEKAPVVAPGEVATVAPVEGVVGLVQALVFAGMDPSSLTYRTSVAGVDCILSGGPFPVTDALASETMDELLKACQERYTITLVIGPALTRAVDTEILAAYAHGIVVVLNELSPAPEVTELVRSIQEAKPGLLLGSVLCL